MLLSAREATAKSVNNFDENISNYGSILGPINKAIEEAAAKGNFEVHCRVDLTGEQTVRKVIDILSILGYQVAFYDDIDKTHGGVYRIRWSTL